MQPSWPGLSRPSPSEREAFVRTPFGASDGESLPSRLFFDVGGSLAAWMAGTSPAMTCLGRISPASAATRASPLRRDHVRGDVEFLADGGEDDAFGEGRRFRVGCGPAVRLSQARI